MSKEWIEIFESNLYILPAAQRIKSTAGPNVESFPYSIEFKGVALPVSVMVSEPKNVHYRLRTCLYDAANRRFFGRPWTSAMLPSTGGAQPRVAVGEAVYFHFPYKDNSILMVLEFIREHSNVPDDDVVAGWGVYRLQPGIQRRDAHLAQLELYQGSPEVLTLLQEPVESCPKLKKTGFVLQFTVKQHKVLARAFDYIPENSIIGSNEVIPGLEHGSEHGGPLENPVLKAPNPGVIDKLVIQLGPMADRIESEVCDLLNKERLFKDNINPNGETMMILEKRIRVGVHNGWTYLHEPYLYYLTSLDTFDTRSLRHGAIKTHERRSSLDGANVKPQQPRGTLMLRNRIELNELVQDEGLALVFYLEYILGLKSSKPNPPAQVVTIAWGVWSPFNKPITGPFQVTLVLRGGPSKNPDYVLCFRDYYSLATEQQARHKYEIQLKFNFILKHFLPPDEHHPSELPIAKPIPKERQKPSPLPQPLPTPTKDGRESLTSSRGTTPAPPPREGRVPLHKITPHLPAQPRGGQVHYPFVLPYPSTTPGQIWGVPPAFPAYPLAAPLGHMAELPMTGPVHAPIYALQQNPVRTLNIPRFIMAILNAASFDAIEDRHGDTPELVDLFDATTFSLDLDLRDPLSCNEIIFQFLAYGRTDGLTAVLPDNVFFTFHFYRFPEVSSERLLLVQPENVKVAANPDAEVRLLRRLDKSGQLISGKPGFQVKFVVDPHYLKPGEHKLFLEYLYYHYLYVDVWDANSLMLIGTCLIPLKQLCRRSYEAVHAYCQLPIVTTELVRNMPDHDPSSHTDIQAVIKGMLYMKVACVGYPSAGGVNALITDTTEASRNVAVITHRLIKSTIGTDLTIEKLLVRPQSLTVQHSNLRPMLITGKKLDITEFSSQTEERQRKMIRVENLRQIERYTYTKIDRTTRLAFSQDIQTIKQFREQTKDKTIMAAIYHSITVVHTIFPTLGGCEFMEFLLVNPYNEPCTLAIDISDIELKVVFEQHEWQFYKNLHNLMTPLETSMFILKQQPGRPNQDVQVQVFLKPKENVYIPFKYQTFHTLTFPNFEGSGDRLKSTLNVLLQNKTVKVYFRNTNTGETVSVLLLQVEPQPHVVHQTFRFYQPEQTFLSKFIRINLQDIRGLGSRSIVAVYCTDPTVFCEIKDPSTLSGVQDIYIKAPCGNSPQVKTFSIMLYVDNYLSKPVQVWQFYVHALQKIDLTTVQGHGTKFSLVIRGGQSDRVIHCFSSSPRELMLSPQVPFVLHPGAIVEVQGQFKPIFTGERTLQITAVDVELRELIKSWLIYAVIKHPNVTNSYQVTIPIGQSKTINKKLSFVNKYSVSRTFTATSSREDLMVVKDAVLKLQPGEAGVIGLRFFTNVNPQVTEIMLFINDELENNEEAYEIKAVFVLP